MGAPGADPRWRRSPFTPTNLEKNDIGLEAQNPSLSVQGGEILIVLAATLNEQSNIAGFDRPECLGLPRSSVVAMAEDFIYWAENGQILMARDLT